MNRGVRRIDFRIRFAAFQHGIGDQPLSDLDGDAGASEIRDFRGGAAGHAQDVGIIELDFGASVIAGGDAIVYSDWGVHSCRDPVSIVAALG